MTAEITTLDEKFSGLTDKYMLARTRDLVTTIEGLGYKMEKFVALKVRKKTRQGFQKHRVIFTSPQLKATSDGVPQLLLTNSHDGTSSVILQLGFFRFVCSNGLIVGDNLIEPIRVRHSGNDFDQRLIIAINNVANQADKLTQSIDKMKSVILTHEEIITFQRDALQNRLKDVKIIMHSMPTHREEDNASDLFTVMNVIQENLIRGGAKVLIEKDNKPVARAVRKINSLVSQTEINTMLWNLAEQRMAA